MKKCFFLFLLLVPALLNAQDRGDRAYITKPGSMYTTYKFGPDEESDITSVVGGDEFSRIDATCRESSWPDGISNLTAFFDNEEDIKRYTTYFVCRFGDNKVLLRVPEGENRSMPSHMRPSETIYFIIGGDAVSYSGGSSSGTTSYTRSAKQVTVTNFGDLYSTYTFSSTDEADIKDAVGSSVFQDIETYANERNWPSAISGFDDRQTNRPKMYNYYVELVCEFGDRVVLRAPVSKNSHMSGGMRLTHDIYFIIGKAGVDLSGGGSSSSSSGGFYKGRAVTVTNFGDLFSTYSFSGADEDDIRDAVGGSMLSEIKRYAHEDNWPSAISAFDDRQTNRPRMYNYNVEYVCSIADDVVIIKAPVSSNSHMQGGMRLSHDIYFVIKASAIEAK